MIRGCWSDSRCTVDVAYVVDFLQFEAGVMLLLVNLQFVHFLQLQIELFP